MPELETVPLDEVAELERMAEAAAQAAKLQAPDRRPDLGKPGSSPGGLARPENSAGSGERGVAPPRAVLPLRPYVETAEVDAHLTQLSERLTRLEDQVTHTMLLVMILGDRQRVTPEEYNAARAKLAQIEGGR